jgi:hypothetical protein
VTVDPANKFARKYDVFGWQETRLREGFPSRIAAGGGGICLIRPFADRTRQEQCPHRAGDPTLAILAARRARPTSPAPEPARPAEQAQKEGVKAALPPAPAEKIAPPIQQK